MFQERSKGGRAHTFFRSNRLLVSLWSLNFSLHVRNGVGNGIRVEAFDGVLDVVVLTTKEKIKKSHWYLQVDSTSRRFQQELLVVEDEVAHFCELLFAQTAKMRDGEVLPVRIPVGNFWVWALDEPGQDLKDGLKASVKGVVAKLHVGPIPIVLDQSPLFTRDVLTHEVFI